MTKTDITRLCRGSGPEWLDSFDALLLRMGSKPEPKSDHMGHFRDVALAGQAVANLQVRGPLSVID